MRSNPVLALSSGATVDPGPFVYNLRGWPEVYILESLPETMAPILEDRDGAYIIKHIPHLHNKMHVYL